MRNSVRLVIAFAATLAVGAWAIPASADVEVFATLYKDKDVYVTVDVLIEKDVDITVNQDATLDGAAQADVNINQVNEDNQVDDAVGGELEDFGLELHALIGDGDEDGVGSVNNNTGIVGVNQDVGNMVNQANNVALAITDSETSFIDAEAWAEQINTYNFAREEEVLEENPDAPGGFDPDRTAEISDSVNENAGVIGVNQNAGNNNNQANGVAMAVGEGAHVALAEAALGQVNSLNSIIGIETVKSDLISNSVNANTGVVGVNQSVGNNNNQGSVTSFSVLTSTVSIEVPGSGI